MLSAKVTVPSMAKLLLQNHGFRRIRSFILSGTVLSNIRCYWKKDEAARLSLYKQYFATAIMARGVEKYCFVILSIYASGIFKWINLIKVAMEPLYKRNSGPKTPQLRPEIEPVNPFIQGCDGSQYLTEELIDKHDPYNLITLVKNINLVYLQQKHLHLGQRIIYLLFTKL